MNSVSFKVFALAMMFLCAVVFGWFGVSKAVEPRLSEYESFVSLHHYSTTSAMTLSDVIALPAQMWNTVPLPESDLSFGYSKETHWIKLSIASLPEHITHLNVNYALLDEISFYQWQSGAVQYVFHTGDALPFSSRPVNSHRFVFPIQPANGAFDIFLELRSKGALKVPLSLSSPDSLSAKLQLDALFMGGYMGFMMLMIFGSMVVIIITKEVDFLFYAIYVAGIALLNLNLNGVLFQWFWPSWPILNIYSIHIISFCVGLAQLLFVRRYLYNGACEYRKTFDLSLIVGGIGVVLSCALPSYAILSLLAAVFVFYVNVLSVWVSWQAWKKQRPTAQNSLYFLLAWLCMLIGIGVLNLGLVGLLPSHVLINNAAILTSMLEMLLLIAAMIDRFEGERQAKKLATTRIKLESEQRENIERYLLFQATHDSMTSLPKKQILLQNWPLICHKIPMNQSIHIVIIHFEGYYSQVLAFGQEVADFLIMELHERLRRRVSQDQAFVVVDLHWNNDKAVVLDSLDVCLIYSGSEWLNRASVFDDFYQTIAQPIMCREVSLDIDLSIGLSLLDRDESVQNAIRRAQVASKEASQRRLHILEYDNKLGHDPEYTTALMTQFQNDLRHKRLVLVFQPQINTTNGELHGVEALIRWQHPEQGWLSPDFFIPLVEQSGLIHELAEYVLIESCRFYQNILAIFQRSLSISINLSARNFTDKNLTRFVSTVLSEYDVPAKKITFELTETAILGDLSTSKLVFQQLLDVGVNIALDDFGVGYSSLVYLKELPFSELKIDKGFLLQDSHTHQGSSLIKAAIELGKALDMLVVAEGVETLALAQMLNQLGCEICQGYFYAKPLSTDEFIEWLQNFDHKRNIIEPDYVAKPSLN